MTEAQIFTHHICLPEQLIREGRVTSLERLLVDSFRRQIRPQIVRAKEELR